MFYVLALIPIMVLFMVWAARRRGAALKRLGDPGLIDILSRSVEWRGRRARNALWFGVLALIVVALARPQWGSDIQAVERRGVQVMVALDISTSMLAQDLKPDRLSRAKLEIADLMRRLGGAEVGLVLFSGASFLQFPLTFDYATARTFLDDAGPHMISRPGTSIGKAIQTALVGFNYERAGQKAIVIFTDGESHEGDPLMAARQALERGVIVYAMGFGSSDGEPIPDYAPDGRKLGFKHDEAGNVIISRLDEVTLQQVAREGGGQYYRAVADGSAVERLAAHLDRLESGNIEAEFETSHIERFQWALAVVLLALVVMELVPERVASWIRRRDTMARAGRNA
jgi:Ca-activated chloride channel family protein